MRFSKQWLSEWVDIRHMDDEQLAHDLTNLGLEIEGISKPDFFSNVIVAEIIEAKKHPEADKLQVCQVSDGHRSYQIVCGAANARSGIKVALSKIGAILPNGIEIKRAKLRNIESEGMLCSEKELGLAETSAGIMELPLDAPLGEKVFNYLKLDDTLFELKITPDRGDCLSIKGLAREVKAKRNNLTVHFLKISELHSTFEASTNVHVNAQEACPRYCTRTLHLNNLELQLPLAMKEKLRRAGLRCIHPIVDVTNYVMLELGQPMHAFDADKVEGNIMVRYAKVGETLELLNDQTVLLSDDILIIADDKKPLAIAGIMGGKASSVTSETQNIILESAYFTPEFIMGKARRYGLHTDSSYRFERGIDSHITREALEYATKLIMDITKIKLGTIVEIKSIAHLPKPHKISLSRERLNDVLGFSIPEEKVFEILGHLEMSAFAESHGWNVITPLHRHDLTLDIDIIHEVARVYGYDNIPSTPGYSLRKMMPSKEPSLRLRQFRNILVELGYHETMTYSFSSPDIHAIFGNLNESMKLKNPISAELSVMRSTLWEGLIPAFLYNQARQQDRIRLFEIGRVYLSHTDQPYRIAGLISGTRLNKQWGAPSEAVDFYDIKANVEELLVLTGKLASIEFCPTSLKVLHPTQSADIYFNDQCIGHVGPLHPHIVQQLGIKGALFLFELNLNILPPFLGFSYKPISKFPMISRDLSILLPETISFQKVHDKIHGLAGSFLSELKLFDIYRGQGIPDGYKSLALRLTLQHTERTLIDDEVVVLMKKIIEALKKELNADLRE